jgi:uncharacterized membrane protein
VAAARQDDGMPPAGEAARATAGIGRSGGGPGAPGEGPARPRLLAVDALRGAALVAMIVYHAAWDLSFLGLIATDVATHLAWAAFARAIAASFLLLVGVSLVLARRAGATPGRALRRIAVIAAAAAAVSAATFAFLPGQGVYFGILHSIALSSLLGLALHRLPGWALAAAVPAVLAAPLLFASPLFDSPWWYWLGLSTEVPPAPDYVPLLPWFAAVLAGMAIGRTLPEPVPRPAPWPARALAAMGRRSLAIYLLHQPVLLGLLSGWLWLVPADETAFLRRDCDAAGWSAAACDAFVGCMVRRLDDGEAPLLGPRAKPPDAADAPRWDAAVAACRAAAEGR